MPEELKECLSPCPCAATEPGKQKNKIYLRKKMKQKKKRKRVQSGLQIKQVVRVTWGMRALRNVVV